MVYKKWNRQAKKTQRSKPKPEGQRLNDPNEYVVRRVRVRKRRKKHCGYTIIPETRYGVFDRSINFGAKY